MSYGTTGIKSGVVEVRLDGDLVQTLALQMGKTYQIGRHQQMAIRLEDHYVSRRHAQIELRFDGVYVTDLRSANGVTLGTARTPISPGVPFLLEPNQSFRIGEYLLSVRLIGFKGAEGDETRRFVGMLRTLTQDLEIIGQLGSGSTGSVWAALDRQRQCKVALKLLHMSIEQTSEEGQRFMREAQLCQRVNSFNVVEVFDVRLFGGRPVMIMELVNGPSAIERLQDVNGAMTLHEALAIGEDVARGLAACAEAGVIHRDVKPSNILISPGGSKISDFGIAKAIDIQGGTDKGIGLGTLAYVAPEQAISASEVDGRADIYGLGATLYHLFTGNTPFPEAQSLPELFKAVTSNELPRNILERREDVPEPIAHLVMAMLERDADKRPPSMLRVCHELGKARLKLVNRRDAPETDLFR